jgi:serine/threonine-protein phosphatase 2A regulatory subunit B
MGPKTPPPPGAPPRTLSSPSSSAGGSFSGRLRLPSVHSTDVVFSARCRRLYGNQHAYHINSLSVNSDCETFISADDLRINLWHLESSGSSFNIVDIKPNNMEDLTEVITSAEFHPNQCNLFAYSSSKGAIRLADMRASALCNNHAKIFDEQEAPGSRSFFCEIIASISDVKFSRDGRYILARDYLTVKLWDINMDSKPVAQFKVHEHLRSKLCDLYESDSIFDKFQCCLSDDGSHLATGSYGNTFRTFDTHAGGADTLEVTKTPQRLRTERMRAATGGSLSASPSLVSGLMGRASGRSSPSAFSQPVGPGSPDFQTKILHMAWHPQEHVLAAAASNSLYIFNA